MSSVGLSNPNFFKKAPAIFKYVSEVDILVIQCIDPRFTYFLSWFLNHQKNILSNYDLYSVPGASCACSPGSFTIVNPNTTPPINASGSNAAWLTTLSNTISAAIALHNIQEVWIFDHLGCGAFTAFGLPDTVAGHTASLERSVDYIKTLVPTATFNFKTFLIDFDGNVSLIKEYLRNDFNFSVNYVPLVNTDECFYPYDGITPDYTPWVLFWVFLTITVILLFGRLLEMIGKDYGRK